MQNGLVSIIMGVRNGSDRLSEAVLSIEQQTYREWEFVICDDCSEDDTYEKLIEYAKDNPKFTIICNKANVGLATTLNHCLKYCKGEFIARMDDDDISYPERFEKQIEFLINHPEIAFVSSSADLYDGEKIFGKRNLHPFPSKKDLIWGSQFIHPATMFRVEALKAVDGYRVSKETRRGQDYDLFMRLYGKGFRGANLTEPVFRYTESPRNLKQRNLQARIGEMKIRYRGYKSMGVLPWAFPFVFKPIFAWGIGKLRIITKRGI